MKLRTEQKIRKLTRNILALLLLIVIVGTGSGISTLAGSTNLGKKVETEVQKKEAKAKELTIVKELEHLRTANSSTYLLSNGSKRLEMYGADIRYEENGKFIDYDPSLKILLDNEKTKLKRKVKENRFIKANKIETYKYVNTAGDSKIYFPESIDEDTGILMQKENYVLSFSPIKNISKDVLTSDVTENERTEDVTKIERTEDNTIEIKENSVIENNITYNQENNDIEYKYTSQPYGVKEEIILNKKPNTNVFSFEFELCGMELKTVEGSKSIQIIDKSTKKMVAYISEPNIKDKNGDLRYSEVRYEIKKQEDGKYILDVVVDEEYLASKSTEYPVTIDPSTAWMHTSLENASVTDMPYTTGINMKNTDTAQVQNKCNTYGPYVGTQKYCYIEIDGLQEADGFAGDLSYLENPYVESAYLRLLEYETNSVPTPSGDLTFTPGTVEVRSAQGEWDPDTITWSNHPNMSETVWAEFSCSGVKLAQHQVDMTEWARQVIRGEIPNYGLVLRAKEEGTGDTFYGSQIAYATDSEGNRVPAYMSFVVNYRDVGRYYGTTGVYAPTGNYSESSNDMTVQTAIGDISLGRICTKG